MDIKSKNIKNKYSNYIVYGLILILTSTIFLSLIEIRENYRYLSSDGLYISGELNGEIESYLSKVVDYSLFYKSEEYVKDKNNITENDIEICKAEIRDKIESEISDGKNSLYNSDSFNNLSYDEQQRRLDELTKKVEEKYNYTDEELEQYILNRKLNSYKTLSNELNSYKNLSFGVYDETDKKWVSNEQKDLSSLRSNSRLFQEVNISPNGNITKKIFVNGKEIKESDYNRAYYHYDYRYYTETAVTTINDK